MQKIALFVVALLVGVPMMAGCGGAGSPISPSTSTTSPSPSPSTLFSARIGEVPVAGALATTQLTMSDSGVVGATVIFSSMSVVIPEIILHEFTHVLGVYHTSRVDFVMYPYQRVGGYAPEELQTLGVMFKMPQNVACPADSSALVKEMVCGDNSANIINPGLGYYLPAHISGNIVMRVDPSLATKMTELQAGADAWAGKLSGFTMTFIAGSSSTTNALSPSPGTRTIIIVD